MKKLILFVMTVMVAVLANAGNNTMETALKKADLLKPGKKYVPAGEGKEKSYYIFNAADGDGFVIVGGNDQMPEVLGWSEQGSIDPAHIPDGLKWLLECYERTARSRSVLTVTPERIARAPRQAVEPLMKTRWSQWTPYNNLCPEVDGKRCLTGCVATAMAQVINYNRWPEGPTSALERLITQTRQLLLPPLNPTTFFWDDMTTDDIARLMLYCGQAVGMDYNLEASGAIPEMEVSALKQVFGYSRDVRFVYSSNYSSDKWEELLYNELKEGRPVIYNGYTTDNAGHTFVLHGYQDGLFYVNWGWGGQGDGYFMLTNLDSGDGIYSMGQCATIGIHSSVNDPVETAKAEIVNFYSQDDKYYAFNNQGVANLWVGGNVRNASSTPASIQIGVGVYDIYDQLVKVVWQNEQDFQGDEEQWFSADFQIGKEVMAPGSYRIVPISRGSDTEAWETDRGASEFYIELTIMENYVKLRTFPLTDDDMNTVDAGIHTIDGITYDLYSVKGKNRALVLPPETGKYKGAIRLPDEVTYEGQSYRLYKAIYDAFRMNPELTSLSTSMYYAPPVDGCENLVEYELREGVTRMDYVINSSTLTSIVLPSTLNVMSEGGFFYCKNLTSIRFNNPRPFTMTTYPRWNSESMPALRDVYFLTDEPPLIGWKGTEFIVNPQVTIHIPKGSLSSWKNSDWWNWNFVEDQEPIFTGIVWGYNTHDELDGNMVPYNLGDNNAEYAIRVPAETLAPLAGNTISSIQFNTCYWGYDYLFITTADKDYLVKQVIETESSNWSWNTVALNEPFVITGEELYIGLGRYNSITTCFSTADVVSPDGFYMRAMGSGEGVNPTFVGKFVKMTTDFPGNLPLRIVLTGDNFPTDIQISNAQVLVTEKPMKLSAKVTNFTSKTIKNYTISWTLDGQPQKDINVSTQLAGGKSETFTAQLPSGIKGKNHSIAYSVTSIDGQADAVPYNSTGTFNFKLPANTFYPRRIVMEEATGTWCGWCVRGLETIDRLNKEYPDNFIAIGIHNEDDMANWLNYELIAKRFNSYPNCLINRQQLLDPYYPSIREMVESQKNSAEAMISASALFSRSDSSAVTVTTNTTFGFSDDVHTDYRIAYVVVEDKVGPYPQKNFYNGTPLETDDFMYGWTQKEGVVKVTFDDVARAVYTDADGLMGCIPATIEEGKAYQYTYGFNLPKNIQNLKNIRIITLLIDGVSGEIMNAAQTIVGKPSTFDTQTFGFSHQGELLPDYASVVIEADDNEYGDVIAETNPAGSGARGLFVTTLDGKQQQGMATLEVLSSTLQAGQMQWCMGGDCVPVTLGQPVEKTFTTDENGQAQVMFDVEKIQQYGFLDARLTVTIGGESHQTTIQVVYEEPVLSLTNLYFHETQLYSGKRYTSADFPDITSGSFKIAKNGRTVTLTNLVTDSDMQEGCLFDFYDEATVVLVGENTLYTQGHVVFSARKSLTLTGNGSVTTKTTWFDFWVQGNDLIFDNTTVTSLGTVSVGNNNMPSGDNLVVKQSTFKGKHLFRLSSLVLVGCDFDSPKKIIFVPNELGETNLKYEDGSKVNEFTIVPSAGDYQYVVVPSPVGKVYLETDSQRTIDVTCQNKGTETVHSVTYEVIIDGEPATQNSVFSKKNTYTLPIPATRIGETFKLPITFTGSSQTSTKEAVIDIVEVNGHPNQAPEHTATATLFTASRARSHRVVVEEFTGTWCQWCTRGIIGLDMLNNQFGDRVITIAAHFSDPMQNDEYGFILSLNNGYPSCVINRGPVMDPYWGSNKGEKPFGIADDVEQLLAEPVVASIEATAAWNDAKKTQIKVNTQTIFGLDLSQGQTSPYQIGYVLVADGLKGQGSAWAQHNVYSGMGTGDSNLKPIENLPELVIGMEYDHVGICAWNAEKGVANSISLPIKKDITQEYTHVCDISNCLLVQDKDKLSIVALLLDAQTGTIVNAAKCKIDAYDPSDISTLDATTPRRFDIYDLSGRKLKSQATSLSGMSKGIYVIDGNKVVVK